MDGIVQGVGGSEWKFSERFVRQESQNSIALYIFPQRYPSISRPHAQVLHSFIKHRAPEYLLGVWHCPERGYNSVEELGHAFKCLVTYGHPEWELHVCSSLCVGGKA